MRRVNSILNSTWTSCCLLLATILLSGCVTTVSTNQEFTGLDTNANIVLMPPDIKYFRVTASGITEPIAEWTESANREFLAALRAYASEQNLNLAVQSRPEMSDYAVEYNKLHSAVGQTILENHYGAIKLPAKRGAFDWSLGDGVHQMTLNPDSQYALFVNYRDYQAGGGRIGMAVFAAALGASIYTGHQGGFASLVDLNTGNVVWFNNTPATQGDMRKPEGATKLVTQLLKDLDQQ